MPEVILKGCTPEPLSGYLKALAVLRLVSEQVDPGARGRWTGGHFVLSSALEEEGLYDFFVNRYSPTPLVAPWNGGSGFYPNDNADALDWIRKSGEQRFESYRNVISSALSLEALPKPPESYRQLIDFLSDKLVQGSEASIRMAEEIKSGLANGESRISVLLGPDLGALHPDDLLAQTGPFKREKVVKEWRQAFRKLISMFSQSQRSGDKAILLFACRNILPDDVLPWLDAAFSLTNDNSPVYAAILGSGGNEGRLDYTNNFMQHIVSLLSDDEKSKRSSNCLVKAALGNGIVDSLHSSSIGQFQPGRAGGFNQGPGFEHKDFPINPWDFVFSMEGAVSLASSVVRRQGASFSNASSPFTVDISLAGFSSSCDADKDKGRAELWLPLWEGNARYAEVVHLFKEGRASVGRRTARNGIDMARAIATFGVDRGVSGFVRYSFLKRRGDSYVALPVARIPVRNIPTVSFLNETDRAASQVVRMARARNAPASIVSGRRCLDEAIFQAALRGDCRSFQQVVIEMGQIARWTALVAGSASGRESLKAPIAPCLSREWMDLIDDGSTEYRIAAALASIGPCGAVGSISANLLPLNPVKPGSWAMGSGQQAFHGPSVVRRLASVFERRLMDAGASGATSVPIKSVLAARPEDVAAFLWGATDDSKIESLLWGMTAVKWLRVPRMSFPPNEQIQAPISNSWCLLKLLYVPEPVNGIQVPLEPRVISMLASGDPVLAAGALKLARHRLFVEGLRPRDFDPVVDFDPIRMAAALLVPVSGVSSWSKRVLRPDVGASTVV